MASTGVNVLRWSALGAGVVYGLYRQSTITAAEKLAAINHEYERKSQLIQQAKAEYIKKTTPQDQKNQGIITDPMDPKFDLEKFLTAKAAEN